ncbi:DUF2062 domain-containing protein [Novosphingopyxis iocasae]|uniref:DUF2062 domain-containing protein n=1 Tax=Novosphingopyxis iocasae TaxID=2762729 RepID=UPI001FE77A0B|nr:DUF2062 domain-containing protein [Novosphingopyxis iocasae]
MADEKRPLHHRLGMKMPTRDEMGRNRFLKPFADRVMRPDLWRFTRRSVPRGIALGMLAGFWIPVGQIFAAALLAWPIRANVPIAAATTFITNPITYPFWVVVANKLGRFILRIDAMTVGAPLNNQVQSEFGRWLSWLLREAGVTAFGMVVLGILFASVGYLLASFAWRFKQGKKRRGRLRAYAIRRRQRERERERERAAQ